MIKAIVCDIEGTTTSLSFVKDTLFPYARQHIAQFITDNQHHDSVMKELDEVRQLMQDKGASIDAVVAQLIQWIDEDRKVTPLKTLQGLIWEHGYTSGDYFGHLYEEAYTNLMKWKEKGIALYIFSSGSIYAQKLLFAHTEFGDLTSLFSGYFDTTTGPKMEEQSYESIAQEIGINIKYILFLSDIKGELDAARQAGMQTQWLVRNDVVDPNARHAQIANFNDVVVD